jgi:hypothetical protein
MSFFIDNEENSLINLNLNYNDSLLSSDIFGGMGKNPSSSSNNNQNNRTNNQNRTEQRVEKYQMERKKEAKEKLELKKENINILQIMPFLVSQYIVNKDGTKKLIETGLECEYDSNYPERRLLSKIDFKKNKNNIQIIKAEHVIPLEIFIENGMLYMITGKKFSNGLSSSVPEQIMKFNPESGEIQFTLEEKNKKFNYVSKYIVDTKNKKIKLNPYTEEEHKKIIPIPKIRCRRSPIINIYKFLNEMEQSNPVTIDSSFSDLKEKLNRIKREKVSQLTNKQKEIQATEHHLESKENREKFDSNLKLWKTNFDEWTWDKKKIMPIEEHEIRFVYQKIGEPRLSTQMGKILENLQSFDSRIKLERDIDNNFYRSVNFGVYTPYLVSYIVRYKQVNYNESTVDALCLTSENINDFSKFIHRFKSACFSIISLYYQLNERIQKQCVEISFRVPEIYIPKNIESNEPDIITDNIVTHNILFKPDEVQSKSVKILKPTIDDTGKKGICDVDSLHELKLEEPLFGNDEFSQIKDFDKLYMDDLNKKNIITGLIRLFTSDIKSNFTAFYEDKFNTKEIIEEVNKNIVDEKGFDLVNDFPILNNVQETINVNNLGAWGSPLEIKTPEKIDEQSTDKTKSSGFKSIYTPVYNGSKDKEYRQKYLKYKNKYMELKNKYNL